MNRSRVVTCVVLLFGLVGSTTRAAQPQPPNVLFIAIDDLNDWVGCLGGHPQVKTPNIDRLATRGTLFTNAHCQAPLCNPSRTSLLTGLRPSTTGIYALAPWFRTAARWRDLVSLPQYFAAHGYTTLTTGKIWHNAYPPRKERLREFDQWGPPPSVGAWPPHKLVPPTPEGNLKLVDWGTFPHRDQDKGDWKVASWAVKQLKSPPPGPFFLAVGFFLPHVPCYATQKWFDLYPDDRLIMPPVKLDDLDDVPEFAWYLHWKLPEPRLSWLKKYHEWRSLVQSYLASVSFMDSQVGRVLDALEQSGQADRTVVVLWSDHGWHLGEKGMSGKTTLWERSTRVPLIFAGPTVPAGARCAEPVELLDIYPTLAALCGLPPKQGLEGHSLVPQLNNPATPRPWPAITTDNQDNHSVRSLHWRYIHYADGSEELYDHRRDPNEWTNLAADHRYDQVRRDHARWLPRFNAPPAPGSRWRLLEKKNGRWFWEGKPIRPAEKMR